MIKKILQIYKSSIYNKWVYDLCDIYSGNPFANLYVLQFSNSFMATRDLGFEIQ